jgi:hypothetical protein
VFLHRGGGGGADQLAVVEGPDDQRAGVVAVGPQILAFVVEGAVVKVGPVAEDGDPEARDGVEDGLEVRAAQGADVDLVCVHALTCRIQSFRL